MINLDRDITKENGFVLRLVLNPKLHTYYISHQISQYIKILSSTSRIPGFLLIVSKVHEKFK